ncbi:heme-dependent oxidative N-demethylase family protein [Chthonobacter rhizosphaerae]|uniref:heme-dependent oxidative N-demethylase family protein n=1 Tax=Chthonobacter rhizosphaerae TaxID=2735553 RepID=UPI0015EF3205|nr:DUF3445 domain-containing protein [Chthonobacter rhizosphaerae]
MPQFAHTPYDGSKKPFTIGLAPLDVSTWIEPDDHLPVHLAEKTRLYAERRDMVFAAEAGTEAAQREVFDALAAHLPARFPDVYRVEGGRLHVAPAGMSVPLRPEEPPILAASRVVQEDLVLMRRDERGWRLVAAALCFPSSWSLKEKFGRTLDEIHGPVPDYAGAMAARMNRIFDALKADIPVWRLNWSIYPDPELHHPESKQLPRDWFNAPSAQAFIRVERQTLTRMPDSGDILFTIKVHVDPVADFARHPDGRSLAAGLRAQLLELDGPQLAYKSLAAHRDLLAARLQAIAEPEPVA